MNCPCCGVPVQKGAAFCPSCGTNMNISGSVPQRSAAIPASYKPISPWGYIGYSLLFAIPIVGFICLIVYSFNGNNINRRNFARSYFCALLIVLILFIAAFALAAATGTTDELIETIQSMAP